VALAARNDKGSATRAVVNARLQANAIIVEDRAAHGVPRLSTLDFENQICSAAECGNHRWGGEGPPMYRDQYHLSVAGAETLTSAFYRAIVARARTPRA
jgi:hypothetical protein